MALITIVCVVASPFSAGVNFLGAVAAMARDCPKLAILNLLLMAMNAVFAWGCMGVIRDALARLTTKERDRG